MAFTIVGDAAIIQGGVDQTRPAAVFTGGNTDDAYAVDALAAAETAANDAVGTITAWICPGDETSTASIMSFNDANVVEFIDFKLVAGKLSCTCTDATTAQFVSTTDALVCPQHKWTHVAVVQAADGLGPKFYVNGAKVASTNSTTTDVNEWFVNLDGIDKGFIGASSTGGAGAISEEFVGAIGDVKYYNTALTNEQIMNDFRGLHLTTGCVAWYKMNNLIDSATGGGTYDMVAVSDVYLTPSYNEFISKFRKFGAVAADIVGIAECNGRITALIVNAA
jgi:hypothetical protein